MKAEWTNKDVLTQSETTSQSKSILVIDTPTRCFDCPLYTSIGYEDDCTEYGFCDDRNILNQKEAQEKIRFDEKPTWCPLRPLPEPKDIGYPNEDYDVGFGDGWDACLNEIEK